MWHLHAPHPYDSCGIQSNDNSFPGTTVRYCFVRDTCAFYVPYTYGSNAADKRVKSLRQTARSWWKSVAEPLLGARKRTTEVSVSRTFYPTVRYRWSLCGSWVITFGACEWNFPFALTPICAMPGTLTVIPPLAKVYILSTLAFFHLVNRLLQIMKDTWDKFTVVCHILMHPPDISCMPLRINFTPTLGYGKKVNHMSFYICVPPTCS